MINSIITRITRKELFHHASHSRLRIDASNHIAVSNSHFIRRSETLSDWNEDGQRVAKYGIDIVHDYNHHLKRIREHLSLF